MFLNCDGLFGLRETRGSGSVTLGDHGRHALPELCLVGMRLNPRQWFSWTMEFGFCISLYQRCLTSGLRWPSPIFIELGRLPI